MSQRQIYDLLVIGGGINGAGVARDAAGRGQLARNRKHHGCIQPPIPRDAPQAMGGWGGG